MFRRRGRSTPKQAQPESLPMSSHFFKDTEDARSASCGVGSGVGGLRHRVKCKNQTNVEDNCWHASTPLGDKSLCCLAACRIRRQSSATGFLGFLRAIETACLPQHLGARTHGPVRLGSVYNPPADRSLLRGITKNVCPAKC